MAGAGRPAYDIIEEQLSVQPAEVRHLVKSINDSLKAGKEVSNIPMGLMTLFRPSVQPYLISWYRYNQQATYANPDLPVQEDLLITIEKFVKR